MKKYLEKINQYLPNLLTSCILALIFSTLSLYASLNEERESKQSVICLAIYSLAGISLCLFVWSLISTLSKCSLKQTFSNWADKNTFTKRFYESYSFRTIVGTHGSLAVNSFLALGKIWAGFFYVSTWFAVLAGYYLIVGIARFSLIQRNRRYETIGDKKYSKNLKIKRFVLVAIYY